MLQYIQREEPAIQQETHAGDTAKKKEERNRTERKEGLPAKGNTQNQAPSAITASTARPKAANENDTWVKVLGRKESAAKKKKDRLEKKKGAAQQEQRAREKQPKQKEERKGTKPKIKPPRRAVVALTVAPGSTTRCEEVLAKARGKIHLSEIGDPNVKIRHTVSGGILIEIPSEESAAKADDLATRLRCVFPEGSEVRISRPIKRSEIKICGLDASISTDEIKEAEVGGCAKEEIKVGEIKKRSPRGMGAAWVQCPSTAAKILADRERIVIGWTAARIEVLKARLMTCFKCLERGHTASNCTSEKDRSNRCYNCGGEGHRARECSAPVKCPVCADAGKPANHRFGGKNCNPPATRTKGTERTTETELAGTTETTSERAEDQTADTHTAHESGREEAMETGE